MAAASGSLHRPSRQTVHLWEMVAAATPRGGHSCRYFPHVVDLSPRSGPTFPAVRVRMAMHPLVVKRHTDGSIGLCAGVRQTSAPSPRASRATRPTLAESAARLSFRSAGCGGVLYAPSQLFVSDVTPRMLVALLPRPGGQTCTHTVHLWEICPLQHLAVGVAADVLLLWPSPTRPYLSCVLVGMAMHPVSMNRHRRLKRSLCRRTQGSRAVTIHCACNMSTTRRACCPTISPQRQL